jgi:hypothetical protein
MKKVWISLFTIVLMLMSVTTSPMKAYANADDILWSATEYTKRATPFYLYVFKGGSISDNANIQQNSSYAKILNIEGYLQCGLLKTTFSNTEDTVVQVGRLKFSGSGVKKLSSFAKVTKIDVRLSATESTGSEFQNKLIRFELGGIPTSSSSHITGHTSVGYRSYSSGNTALGVTTNGSNIRYFLSDRFLDGREGKYPLVFTTSNQVLKVPRATCPIPGI